VGIRVLDSDRAREAHRAIEEAAETDRQLSITVASLVVGTIATVGAGAWDFANSHASSPRSPDGPLISGIAGGVVTAGLGTAVLIPRPRGILFVHEHNVLTPIRDGTDPASAFPRFIFRLLDLPTVDGSPTPREELVSHWTRTLDEADVDDRPLVESVIFGAGGVYDFELLEAHAEMLQELGAALDALASDIDALGRVVAVLLRAARETPNETASD